VVLAVAAVVHVLAVWALPRVIMAVVLQRAAQQAGPSGVIHPPRATGASRTIVMPSPDLLYAACVYDLARGPVRVTADPRLDGYWSIALYGATSDNWFAVNDRQAGGQPVDFLVTESGATRLGAVPAGARVLDSPSRRGLVLMRVLAGGGGEDQQRPEAARRTLACSRVSR
jgi:uncharacterized membrane protein